MNEIVKYDNCMNSLKFSNFTVVDLNMLMALCAKAKDMGTEKLQFSFEELRRLTGYKQTSDKQFVSDLKRMNKKLMQVTCDFTVGSENYMFVLFPTFITNDEKQLLHVSVNADFAFILNEIANNFTRFELTEFVELESKYSKNLYRLLKQFRTQGVFICDIDSLKSKLDSPQKYQNKTFIRDVLSKATEELKKCFANLEYNIIYAKKRGRPIQGVEFTFVPENAQKQRASKAKTTKTKKPKNTFTDISQRQYSSELIEQMERQMLMN